MRFNSENAICFSIPVMVCVLIAGCSVKKEPLPSSDEKAAIPGKAESPAPETVKEAPKPVFEGPGELLPKSAGAFVLSSGLRYFGPDNLYDLINGGAEIYVEFGLVKMVTADFNDNKRPGITVTVEIYDMKTPRNAFGRFARFLKGRKDAADAGKGLPESLAPVGLIGASNASFYKGAHLVNLTLMDESAGATMESIGKLSKEILPAMAESVAKEIKAEAAIPKELAWFPVENLQPRSHAYEVQKLAGIDGLGAGFTADYKTGDTEFTLFLTEESESPKSLEEVLKKARGAGKKLNSVLIGKRLAGVVARAEGWTAAHEKQAAAALESLKTALESQ